jgi:iron complex transport system permease protein
MKKKNRKIILFLIILLMGAVVWSLLAGNEAISPKDVLMVLAGKISDMRRVIVFQVRIPRVVAAAAVGAALSVSGYLLQSNLDNTLASPGILGINNGAGLFVLLSACLFPYQSEVKCVAAFLGAMTVTLLIYLLTVKTGMSKTSVVLSGVAVSAFCISIIDVILSLKPEVAADKVAFQIGGFGSLSSSVVYAAVSMIVVGLIAAVILAPSLDLLLLGDDVAFGLGLNVRRFRVLHIVCAALLSGAAVSMSGVLGFVGLIVPNVVRLFHLGKSREGIFFCMTLGSAFLLICDTLGRIIVFPYELPCGLFLSLLGAPFLVWMLVRRRKRLGVQEV